MATTDRPASSPLDLLEAGKLEPHRFDFYHLLRLLESRRADLPRMGYAALPRDEGVRLGQRPYLDFAPSTVRSAVNASDGRWAVNVAFFGLFGPQGPLPFHLTEYLFERAQHQHDEAPIRFLNLFHHRLLLYFYRAWADARAIVGRDRPESDRFGERLAALSGRGAPEYRGRDSMPDEAKLFYSGALSALPRRPGQLRRVLEQLLGVSVAIEDFHPRWMSLPKRGWWRLGSVNGYSELGRTAIVGTRVFDVQSSIRLRVGPLTLTSYEGFLPTGDGMTRLRDILRNYLGDELEWDVNLLLRSEEVPPCELGKGPRLGWTCWLGKRCDTTPAADLVLRPVLSDADA